MFGRFAAVQFMIGVVTVSGLAEIAHMANSVMYSTSVMFESLPFACAARSPFPVSSMSISFHPYGVPLYSAGIAAESRICDFVDFQTPSWSPDMRHDWAHSSPHSHGFSSPHSHTAAERGGAQRGEREGKEGVSGRGGAGRCVGGRRCSATQEEAEAPSK